MDNFNPSGFLFPLTRLPKCSTEMVEAVIEKLALIYFKGDDAQLVSGRHGKGHVDRSLARLDTSLCATRKAREFKKADVVDSGYASAEEEDGAEEGDDDDDFTQTLETIRNDSFERDFIVRWLTGFISRSSTWLIPTDIALSDEEIEERVALVESAASLLSSSATVGEDEDEALSRRFTFPLLSDDENNICVELNDLVSSEDHSSVGLQSWASSIHFARLMAEDPVRFSILPLCPLRILELGAGTGMLSIASAKILHTLNARDSIAGTEIVATDYHPDVLTNLEQNIRSNLSSDVRSSVTVHPFDWQHPYWEPPFDIPFDIILAADVVYDPCHAGWIKNCVSWLLKKPNPSCPEGGIFWMIIALRPAGRHERLADAIFDVFPTLEMQSEKPTEELSMKAVEVQDLERCEGVGRKDEAGYRLLKICWT